MQIVPYTTVDSDGILNMLEDHVDYAPEQVTGDTHAEDIAFFEEAFLHENDGIIAYTLKEAGKVIGFVTLTRRHLDCSGLNWCITALFVRRDQQAEAHAVAAIDLLTDLLEEKNLICVAVHPVATQIIHFWHAHGFEYTPSCSVFLNADNERLHVYRRRDQQTLQ